MSKYIYAIVCFLMVLLLDGRAAFFSIILVLLFFFIIKFKKNLFIIAINNTHLIFVSNYLFSLIYKILSDFLKPIFEEYGLNRGNSSSFSDREIVWDSVLNFFSNFDIEHIIGYGMWGQYPSGLYANYESLLFSNFFNKKASLFSLHSTTFQQLINVGYLGVCVFIVLTFFSIKSLIKLSQVSHSKYSIDNSYAISTIGVILYLIMVGNFDSVVTQERLFATNIYLLLVMSSLKVRFS